MNHREPSEIVSGFDGLAVVRYREKLPNGCGPFGMAGAFRMYPGDTLTSADLEVEKMTLSDVQFEIFKVDAEDIPYNFDDDENPGQPFSFWLAGLGVPWWAIQPIMDWVTADRAGVRPVEAKHQGESQ